MRTVRSKRPDAALKLMVFLSGDTAQSMYAAVNYEYPVKPGVAIDPEVASWGTLKPDTTPLQAIADLSPKAAAIYHRVGLP